MLVVLVHVSGSGLGPFILGADPEKIKEQMTSTLRIGYKGLRMQAPPSVAVG